MAELLEAAPNALNTIESTDTAKASTITILKQAIVDAAKLSKQTSMTDELPTHKTKWTTETIYQYQAAIGAKEAVAKAIT